MPYFIKKIDNGFKVCMDNEPKRCFSKNPLPKSRAVKQLRAIGITASKQKMKGSGIDNFICYLNKKLFPDQDHKDVKAYFIKYLNGL